MASRQRCNLILRVLLYTRAVPKYKVSAARLGLPGARRRGSLLEQALSTELTEHLGYEKPDRMGYSPDTVTDRAEYII